MPDILDDLQTDQNKLDAEIHSLRYNIPKGEPGICTACEEPSTRLIGNRCAPCRDGRKR